jgi:hypothetical protein
MGGGNTPENSVIHLLPGTYHTHGRWGFDGGPYGFVIKDGWRIIGAGIGKTILKLRHAYAPSGFIGRYNTVLRTSETGTGNFSNISVSDLTIDCNYSELAATFGESRLNLTGVYVSGKENLSLERILVVNAAGKMENQSGSQLEAFVIGLSTADSSSTPATGISIRDCEVSSFQGGYCSAIGIYGKSANDIANPSVGKVSGVIQNCRVKFSPWTTGDALYAYNISGASGSVLQNNVTWNAMRGFNNDEGSSENLVIRGNMLLGISGQNWGIFVGAATNSVIEQNTIEIKENDTTGITLAGAGYQGVTGASDCVVRGNIVRYSYGVNFGTGSSSFAFPAQLATNCTFENNRIDSRLGNSGLVSNNNIYWLNNTDLLGNNTLPNISTWQTSTVKANR